MSIFNVTVLPFQTMTTRRMHQYLENLQNLNTNEDDVYKMSKICEPPAGSSRKTMFLTLSSQIKTGEFNHSIMCVRMHQNLHTTSSNIRFRMFYTQNYVLYVTEVF